MLSIGSELLYKIVEQQDLKTLSKLKRDLFVDEEIKLYDYVVEFLKKYKTLPTIKAFCRDNQIEEQKNLEPIEYYKDKLLKRYNKNAIMNRVDILNKLLADNKVEDILNVFTEIITDVKDYEQNLKDNFYTYEELLKLSLENSLNNRNKNIIGITTGWETLDKAINGFTNGNFYVVLARVKMGKSAILIRMSKSAYYSGKKILFFSLEMPAIEIADRLLGMEFNLNKTLITKGRIPSFVEKEIKENLNEISFTDNYKFIDGQFSVSIEDVLFAIQQYKPDIVYIDGAYLLRSSSKHFKSKWELVTHTAEELKFIAMKLQIPIVASYQFNRNIGRKATSVSDKGFENIGLSDAISQLTSVGIALLKPDDSDTTREIEIFGSRDGETDKFTINWDWNTMRFDEVKGYE